MAADPLAPEFALRSEVVYREQVGLAVFVGGYGVLMLLRLAFEGHLIRSVVLPGGAGFETVLPSTRDLEDAYRDTVAAVRAADETIAELDRRLSEVEAALDRRDPS